MLLKVTQSLSDGADSEAAGPSVDTVQSPPFRPFPLNSAGTLATVRSDPLLQMGKLGSITGRKHIIQKFKLNSISYVAGCSHTKFD